MVKQVVVSLTILCLLGCAPAPEELQPLRGSWECDETPIFLNHYGTLTISGTEYQGLHSGVCRKVVTGGGTWFGLLNDDYQDTDPGFSNYEFFVLANLFDRDGELIAIHKFYLDAVSDDTLEGGSMATVLGVDFDVNECQCTRKSETKKEGVT